MRIVLVININDYISSIVKLQESSEPSEAASSNHPIRHRRHKDNSRREDGVHHVRHKHHKVQEHNNNYQNNRYYIDQPEITTSSGARPSSWINDLFSWAKEKGGKLASGLVSGLYEDTTKELKDSKPADIQINSSDQLKYPSYDQAQEIEFQYMSKYDARKSNDKNVGAHSKKRGNDRHAKQQYETKVSNEQSVISKSVNQSRVISSEKQQRSEVFHSRPKPTLSHHSDKKHSFDVQPKKISERKEHTVNHKQFNSNSHKHNSQYKPMIDTNNKWSERISSEKIRNRKMIGNINQNQRNSHSSKHGHYQQGFHKHESHQGSSGTSKHPPLTRVTAQLDMPSTLSLLNLTTRLVTKVKDQQSHSYKYNRMPKDSIRISKAQAESLGLKIQVKK